MKRKKQWFAVILAGLLAVGQGIVSAAPSESMEAQTEEQPESAPAASETKQETTEKQGVKEGKVSQEIGGGDFQKKEIIPLRC